MVEIVVTSRAAGRPPFNLVNRHQVYPLKSHAGDWLDVMRDCEFRHCLQYWLGLRIMKKITGALPVQPLWPMGICGVNGDRIHRHGR